jgi:hypothetical protein
VSWNPTTDQLGLEAEVIRIGSKLMAPALEDEGEWGDRWWVMEDAKHIVVVGELYEKVLQLETLNHEAAAWDVEAIRNPTTDLWQ